MSERVEMSSVGGRVCWGGSVGDDGGGDDGGGVVGVGGNVGGGAIGGGGVVGVGVGGSVGAVGGGVPAEFRASMADWMSFIWLVRLFRADSATGLGVCVCGSVGLVGGNSVGGGVVGVGTSLLVFSCFIFWLISFRAMMASCLWRISSGVVTGASRLTTAMTSGSRGLLRPTAEAVRAGSAPWPLR